MKFLASLDEQSYSTGEKQGRGCRSRKKFPTDGHPPACFSILFVDSSMTNASLRFGGCAQLCGSDRLRFPRPALPASGMDRALHGSGDRFPHFV